MHILLTVLLFQILSQSCKEKSADMAVKFTETGQFLTFQNNYCNILYDGEALKSDAEQFSNWLNEDMPKIANYLGFIDDIKTVAPNCKLFLYSYVNENASASTNAIIFFPAQTNNGIIENAELHFIPLKLYSAEDQTVVGEPKDENYLRKVLAHEYLTIIIDIMASKSGIGSIYNAPNWFAQGLQEFLALSFTSEHSSKVTFPLYIESVKQDPQIIDMDFGMFIGQDYVGGAVLFKFIHDTYPGSIKNLLASNEVTIGKAFTREFGDFFTMKSKWIEWIKKQN